jgi:hypothetical protein
MCWNVFTVLLPGNALIKSVTVLISSAGRDIFGEQNAQFPFIINASVSEMLKMYEC